MDFHAWFEVWLGSSWWTFDARFNTPRIGRLAIGRGRDAVDVAMVTTYGAASLRRMIVWADEVSDDAELTTASLALEAPGDRETLGDLIATLGSIDDDEIDWQNVRQTTVLIQQTFSYEYPGPIAALRHRLMVVPPDYHDDQRLLTHKIRVSGCDVDTERSYDTFGNVVLDLSLEHVEREVEFTTWAVVEREAAVDGTDTPTPSPSTSASPSPRG